MADWYHDAEHIPWEGRTGGKFTNGPFRGVLHTTESKNFYPSTKTYYGHKNPPHFTLHDGVLFQHYPLSVASRTLVNAPGGVQTNRRSAIQIEIAWLAKDINNMPKRNWEALEPWMRWVEIQTGIEPTCPNFGGVHEYGLNNPLEFSNKQWKKFNGWCGHQHVPENKHWDPGSISVSNLMRLGLEVE